MVQSRRLKGNTFQGSSMTRNTHNNLLAFTGMRIGELQQLQWEDVDSDHSVVHVHRGGSGGRPKDKEDRFIPIHARKLKPLLQSLPRQCELVFLGWMGHSSSAILDMYFTMNDRHAQAAMNSMSSEAEKAEKAESRTVRCTFPRSASSTYPFLSTYKTP